MDKLNQFLAKFLFKFNRILAILKKHRTYKISKYK
jgi:hypothetical protein